MQPLKKVQTKFPQKCSWPTTTAPLGRASQKDDSRPILRTMQPHKPGQSLSERMEEIRKQLW